MEGEQAHVRRGQKRPREGPGESEFIGRGPSLACNAHFAPNGAATHLSSSLSSSLIPPPRDVPLSPPPSFPPASPSKTTSSSSSSVASPSLVTSEPMFPRLGTELGRLEAAIDRFRGFLEHHDEIYPYLHGFLRQFFDLSGQVRSRMDDLQTLYTFLNGHHLSASKASAGYFSVLPEELCLCILSYLEWHDLCTMSLLNRQWQSLSRDNMLWKALCAKHYWRGTGNTSAPLSAFDSHATSSSSSPSSTSALCPRSLISAVESDSAEEGVAGGGQDSAAEPPPQKKAKMNGPQSLEALSSPFSSSSSSPSNSLSPQQPLWLDVFKSRLLVERNWQVGNCTVRALSPQSQEESAAFCLHFNHERFVTATDSIEVFDINTGELIKTLRGHTDSVMCLDINSKWIVSGAKDNTIRVWDVATGRERHVLDGHANGVRTVRFDDRIVVSGSRDTTIKVWDLEKGAPLRTMTGHSYTVYCLEFDNRYVISGSVDKTIRVWDVNTGDLVTVLKGHGNSIRCLKFDQSRLVSGAWDNQIKLWDIETSKCVSAFKGHTDRVMCLQFDQNKIVSGSVDKTVRIWDTRSNCPTIILKGHNSCVYDLHFDDFKIVSASKDRGLITWDFAAPRPRGSPTAATLDSEGCYVFEAALKKDIPAPHQDYQMTRESGED